MVPTPQALHGLSVLVVDDHHDTVDMFQQYLSLCGAQVTGAGSANAALAVLETQTVDAAVVDLRMPREDGWSFLSQLRASRTRSAHAAVFAVSGERHEQLDPASGFAGYFFKPVDLDALVAALADLPRRSE
jgi:CheY-like chemotaxis protein